MDPRYPIGKYEPQPFSAQLKQEWINDIKFLPQTLENALSNLDASQLGTPYREGGWTVQQVVHHVADSHLNAYCRFKLGLTEDHPTIRPYDQEKWSELPDSKNIPVNVSITLLHALHARWHEILVNIKDADFEARGVFHPEYKKQMTLWYLLGMYAWHSKHHTAHITSLRERMKW
ncbi:MAG TPA: bacillithiol transferase BstA [Chitinophagaceae bacterium]|nr:bacillithiol transferase BstA [Chitinophagaceae bacterium]